MDDRVLWDLKGKRINALYLGKVSVEGVVTNSEMTWDDITHKIKLDQPQCIFGKERDEVCVDQHDITFVRRETH
tara:strand:- start:510 stop:731 length:222 start_codon:yes stop_codon:yes gene_type:complete